MSSKIEHYVTEAINIANDNSHGYSQINRNGNPDYDCSSLVIDVVNRAGIPVKNYGASYTGNMLHAFVSCGFIDVTKYINLANGNGLKRGDILLNTYHHTEIYIGDGKNVGAHSDEKGGIKGDNKGDQTGNEISVTNYYNYPWQYVLRYTKDIEPAKYSTYEIAKRVINGEYGNGEARKKNLTMLGYDYEEIQKAVNEIMSETTIKKSVNEIAQEVLAGKWGNGNERKTKLEQAGYNYNDVQTEVNRLSNNNLTQVALDCIKGKYGNGAVRKRKLESMGYNYNEVQSLVNKLKQ